MTLTAAHLIAGVILGGDSVAIGIYSPSFPPPYSIPPPPPPPPFSPSLISLMVSVGVKHNVYLLLLALSAQELCELQGGGLAL